MVDPKTLREGDKVLVQGYVVEATSKGATIDVCACSGAAEHFEIISVEQVAFHEGDPVTVLASETCATSFAGEIIAIHGDHAWIKPLDGSRPLTSPITKLQRRDDVPAKRLVPREAAE